MFSTIRSKVTSFLKQGITPEKLALCVAFGVCLGIIPVLGTTTVLCLAAAIVFRFNVAISQLIMHLVYPLQLLLFIPFLKFGAAWFGNETLTYSFTQIVLMFKQDVWKAIADLFWINVWGLLLWIIITPFLFMLIYFFSRLLFSHLLNRMKTRKPSAH